MLVRSPAQGPPERALRLSDGPIVDARDASLHEAIRIELPVLVAIGPEPVARVVAPFIGETHGDAVSLAGPQFLDQPVVQLPRPFAHEELLDRRAAGDELRPVAPYAIGRVGQRHALCVTAVPRVLGHAHLLRGGLRGEGREGGARLFGGGHGVKGPAPAVPG